MENIINKQLKEISTSELEDERLAQASGALADIYLFVTNCVSPSANPETIELAKNILDRIMCSADCVRHQPRWYRHTFEVEAWSRYLSGETKAVWANDKGPVQISCLEYAKKLCKL